MANPTACLLWRRRTPLTQLPVCEAELAVCSRASTFQVAGGSDGKEWRPRNANGWEQAQTAHSHHPTALVCLSPSTATCGGAQELRMAGKMNHLSTIPPKTTRVGGMSPTRLNKRASPGDSRRFEEHKEVLGPPQTSPHLQPASLCTDRTQAMQTKVEMER